MKKQQITLVLLALLSIFGATAQRRTSKFKLFKLNDTTSKLKFLNNQTKREIQDTKQSLDSIYDYEDGELTYKSTFTYNDNGLTLTDYEYELNDDNVLELDYSSDYTYDANGKLVELLKLRYDGYYKCFYTYNTDDKLEQELTHRYVDATDTWENYEKEDYTYTTNGYERINSSWDNGSWRNVYKENYTLNNDGLVIESISSYWNTNAWTFSGKTEKTYNGNNQILISQGYYWNSSDNDWIMSDYRKRYEYNVDNKIIYDVEEKFNTTTSVWEIKYQTAYEYDDENNLTSEIYYSTYNDNGDTVDLHPTDKELATNYNNTYSYTDLLLPEDFDDISTYFNHMLLNLSWYEWDETSSSWIEEGTVDLYYSPSEVASTENTTLLSSTVFPNPFQSTIRFNVANTINKMDLKLFDIQGRLVVEKQIENHKNIEINNLKSGVYFYELISKDNILKGKVIKE